MDEYKKVEKYFYDYMQKYEQKLIQFDKEGILLIREIFENKMFYNVNLINFNDFVYSNNELLIIFYPYKESYKKGYLIIEMKRNDILLRYQLHGDIIKNKKSLIFTDFLLYNNINIDEVQKWLFQMI